MTLRAERQSARMSKITNDGITQFGIGCFIAVPIMATIGGIPGRVYFSEK